MAQFMLMLYADPAGFHALSPEEMQKALEKYMAWRNKPFTIDGHRLGDDAGRIVRTVDGKVRASDGPYSETKEVLGGFYLIEAANYEEAVKLAMTNPGAEHGTIEVRQVFGT